MDERSSSVTVFILERMSEYLDDKDQLKRMALAALNEKELGIIDSYFKNIRVYQDRVIDRAREIGMLDERLAT